ncbi:TerD family protein [Actinomadura hibisca]|uniref:TerD family protein n=1 Tax=Actinomadura hibisca TaxID=68565 RepID=UPI0008328076|nr:TerD family protein [Actinomadura hibisca]
MSTLLAPLVLRHTRRVCVPPGPEGEGAAMARRFDAALMTAGFKLSAGLLETLSAREPGTVATLAVHTLGAVREMVGDHVQHNVYFIDFPANVPDTLDFWMECVADALVNSASSSGAVAQLQSGVLDLLSLPAYGDYRHTYEQMLAAHDDLIAAAGDRVTVLHQGGDLDDEATALYLALAGSPTPLNDADLDALRALAALRVDGPQPADIPIRENRALINRARLDLGAPLLLDTVTDVLRLACALSDGDVTLREPTRFARLRRPVRRTLLAGLDEVIAASPAKLADVNAHREPWKRLGERLHPHEYPRWPHAADVFAVARGDKAAPSMEARVEALLAREKVSAATDLLATAPGKLMRSLDRLLRLAATDAEYEHVLATAERVAPQASGRVLLSVREHLLNREDGTGRIRLFTNRLARAHATRDRREPLPEPVGARLAAFLDGEVRRRLPDLGTVLVEPAALDIALPLSGKAAAGGFGVLPRGSTSPVEGDLLRFFVHWRQVARRTDFDLSAMTLDAAYETLEWLSYTSLTTMGGAHSGDITSAPDGASEFIDLRLGVIEGAFIVPQVNIYAGEGFEEVAESFFGFMLRGADQAGRPFEASTVRLKSDLRGPGRVALPLVFLRDADGTWRAKWLHLYLRGTDWGNRVEDNHAAAETLVRAVVERRYLTVRDLTDLLPAGSVRVWDGAKIPAGTTTFIGLERPDGLPEGCRAVTPENLRDLIPD